MLRKILRLGINGILGNWFKKYLNGRKQLVELKLSSFRIHHSKRRAKGISRWTFFLYLTQYMDSPCQRVSKELLKAETQTTLILAKQYCSANGLALNENKTNRKKRKYEISWQ